MAEQTIQKELNKLRIEVEELKKQKLEQAKEQALEDKKQEEIEQEELLEVQKKAEEIVESLEEGKLDAKEALNNLIDSIKKDYESLSPTSAIVLFALGAAFGNALSSK